MLAMTTMTTTVGTRAIGRAGPTKLARRATVKRTVVSAQKKIIADDETANARDVGAAVSALAIAAATVAMPEMAHASGGEFGILEGRSAALLHPIGLGSL